MDFNGSEVRDAVVLLAGAGSRLSTARGAFPKPLMPVLGRPLISYVMAALYRIGVRTVHAVVGAHAAEVVSRVTESLPRGLRLNAIENPEWRRQNGISVLAAAPAVTSEFFLLMGDHIFDFAILERLREVPDRSDLRLAIDRKVADIFDIDDAMKVRTKGDRVVEISKTLATFDAVDTGLFLANPELFAHLEQAKANGDCSLADGVRAMAQKGKVRAVDIGSAWWQDVDTPAMLEQAEQRLAAEMRRDALATSA
jgi:1L-myo-inositol 1-phosphate cytidylyltransferase